MPAHLADRRVRPRAPGELLQVGADNPAANNGALREANRLLEQHEYDKAEVILTRLAKENPRDPEPLASLVRSQLDRSELGDLWRAETRCGSWECIDVHPQQLA